MKPMVWEMGVGCLQCYRTTYSPLEGWERGGKLVRIKLSLHDSVYIFTTMAHSLS